MYIHIVRVRGDIPSSEKMQVFMQNIAVKKQLLC